MNIFLKFKNNKFKNNMKIIFDIINIYVILKIINIAIIHYIFIKNM